MYNRISTGFILPDYHYIQQETEIKQLIERYNSDQLLDRTGRQVKGIDDTLAVDIHLFFVKLWHRDLKYYTCDPNIFINHFTFDRSYYIQSYYGSS